MAEDFVSDLEELKQLLGDSKRPGVQRLLRLQIENLEKEARDAAQEKPVDDGESSAEKSAETGASLPSAEQPGGVQGVLPQDKGLPVPLQKITKTVEPHYITLSSFGWDQELDRVKVYISLEGALKEKIASDFKANSFELKIHDLGGKNYRCGVAKLHKAIVPDSSTILVKAKKVVVVLKKVEKASWSDIQYKEDKFKNAKNDDKDPMAGVMNLMKSMYEEGDDETKRTIAKAWTESQSGKKERPF